MKPVENAIQYVVYQDLNDASVVLVCRTDEIVAGTFKVVAGPFDRQDEAEKAARKVRGG